MGENRNDRVAGVIPSHLAASNPTPCRTIPCRDVPYHAVPSHAILYHTTPHHTTPHNIPYHTPSRPTPLQSTLSYPIQSNHIPFYPAPSHSIVSHAIPSHPPQPNSRNLHTHTIQPNQAQHHPAPSHQVPRPSGQGAESQRGSPITGKRYSSCARDKGQRASSSAHRTAWRAACRGSSVDGMVCGGVGW